MPKKGFLNPANCLNWREETGKVTPPPELLCQFHLRPVQTNPPHCLSRSRGVQTLEQAKCELSFPIFCLSGSNLSHAVMLGAPEIIKSRIQVQYWWFINKISAQSGPVHSRSVPSVCLAYRHFSHVADTRGSTRHFFFSAPLKIVII